MLFRKMRPRAASFSCAVLTTTTFAGVVNPDISLIGQVRPGWNDNPASIDANRPTLALGETELTADAALNPYSTGTFVFSFAEGAVDVEEAYLRLDQALPMGLAIKAGKYRAPFGKLNPTHPHAYNFLDAPHILDRSSGLMPGGDSYDEPAIEVSELLPGVGSWAPLLSVDIQQGSGFRTSQDTAPGLANYDPVRGRTVPSWLVHLGNSFQVADDLVGDFGVSVAEGATNVEADQNALLIGSDLKLKYELSPQSKLGWQSELIGRHDDVDDKKRLGMVHIADWSVERWNVGGLYEQLSDLDAGAVLDRSVKAFAGFSLMEETTLFRLALERRWIGDQDPVHTVSAQILFSMGPHKPHQF